MGNYDAHAASHSYPTFPLVSGTEQVGVKDQLPVTGVDLILGNEFAGGKMFPATPEAAENPAADVFGHAPSGPVSLQFSMCGCSCTDLGDAVDISHTFFKEPKTPVKLLPGNKNESVAFTGIPNNLCLAVDKEQFSRAQQSDSTLSACLCAARRRALGIQPVLC